MDNGVGGKSEPWTDEPYNINSYKY